MKWTLKTVFIAGSALILVVNGIVLAGVAYNRGASDSTLRLSDRELRPAFTLNREDSALALRLRWRVLPARSTPAAFEYSSFGESPAWLDAAKMASLGFDTTRPDGPHDVARSFSREQARDVFLALEFDGPAYQASLRAANAEADRLRARGSPEAVRTADRIVPLEREANSRVFVVDAGLDAAALRAKYPDRAHYAIVRGQVAPTLSGQGDHRGRVQELSISAIHVPVEMRAVFLGAAPEMAPAGWGPNAPAVRYEAEVKFGRRLEPWLAAAARK